MAETSSGSVGVVVVVVGDRMWEEEKSQYRGVYLLSSLRRSRMLAGFMSPCMQPWLWRNASPLMRFSARSAHCAAPIMGSNIVFVVSGACLADLVCASRLRGIAVRISECDAASQPWKGTK